MLRHSHQRVMVLASRRLSQQRCRRPLLAERFAPVQSSRLHQHCRRPFSSKTKPRFQVPAHVAAFSLLMVPVLIGTFVFGRYGDEEALEEDLRERYQVEHRQIHAKNKNMAEFFQKAVYHQGGGDGKIGSGARGGGGEDVEDQLDAVLKAGYGEKKRLHAVDTELYGTEEGVSEKKRTLEQIEKLKRRKKRQKRKRRKQQEEMLAQQEAVKAEEEKEAPRQLLPTLPKVEVSPSTVATVAVVGALAAVAGFVGGRRSS